MPVARHGDRFVTIFHLEQLRQFLGLPGEAQLPPYAALAAAFERVLDALERAAHELPSEHLPTVTHVQGRDARELVLFMLAPLRGFPLALDTGTFPYMVEPEYLNQPIGDAAALGRMARAIRAEVIDRAMLVTDEQAQQSVMTTRGPMTQLMLLDYLAARTAYFLLHLYQFLRAIGVEPRDSITQEAMAPIHTRHHGYV